MDILTNSAGGRLGNQLYYVLQAYIRNKPNNIVLYNNIGKQDQTQMSGDIIYNLNIGRYVSTEQVKPTIFLEKDNYYQNIYKDFTEDQLNSFISNTIIKCDYIHNKFNDVNYQDRAAIHIRNGDYLYSRMFMCYDRKRYIQEAYKIIPDKIKIIEVYSDDINISKRDFESILINRFDTIIYHPNNTPVEDILSLACHKYKILSNSTFGYWSAFIGDVLYKNNSTVILPERFTRDDSARTHGKRNWMYIEA